jgi:hypothetical protein
MTDLISFLVYFSPPLFSSKELSNRWRKAEVLIRTPASRCGRGIVQGRNVQPRGSILESDPAVVRTVFKISSAMVTIIAWHAAGLHDRAVFFLTRDSSMRFRAGLMVHGFLPTVRPRSSVIFFQTVTSRSKVNFFPANDRSHSRVVDDDTRLDRDLHPLPRTAYPAKFHVHIGCYPSLQHHHSGS